MIMVIVIIIDIVIVIFAIIVIPIEIVVTPEGEGILARLQGWRENKAINWRWFSHHEYQLWHDWIIRVLKTLGER